MPKNGANDRRREVLRMKEVRTPTARSRASRACKLSHERVEGFAGSCKSFPVRSPSPRAETLIQIEFRFRAKGRTSWVGRLRTRRTRTQARRRAKTDELTSRTRDKPPLRMAASTSFAMPVFARLLERHFPTHRARLYFGHIVRFRRSTSVGRTRTWTQRCAHHEFLHVHHLLAHYR